MGSANKLSQLSQLEVDRLKGGLRAAMALPFVDSVRDFVWEVIFSYMRGIDPVFIRSKLLFDVVDQNSRTGWSCKTLKLDKRDIRPGTYEYVIQWADVVTKAKDLGYPGLSLEDDAQRLGNAVLTHWNRKIDDDAKTQDIASRRYVLLLKNNTNASKLTERTRMKMADSPAPSDVEVQFVCVEGEVRQYALDEIIWEKRNLSPPSIITADRQKTGNDVERARGKTSSGRGLVGRKRTTAGKAGEEIYIWYSNQKQLFEKFTLTEGSFEIVRFAAPTRLPIARTVELLNQTLDALPNKLGSNPTAQA